MKYVVITGASRGLGRSLVETFLASEYTVFAGALKNEMCLLDELKKTHGDRLVVVQMDVTCEDEVKNAAKVVAGHTNVLHALVSNAGIFVPGENNQDNPMDINMEGLANAINVNVYGSMLPAKYFVPMLLGQKGATIINVTSEAGSVINAAGCYDPYCISKTTMNMVSNKMKLLLNDHGIRVFAVHPGRMRTDMSKGSGDITSMEAAVGITNIVEDKIKVDDKEGFIDYLGKMMVP